MYRIYVNKELFCDSRIDDMAIINPVVRLEANKAGDFTCTIPPEHPKYDLIKKRKSEIEIYRDDDAEPIFSGFCVQEIIDFYKQKKIVCEGELSYLNDSILRPARYQGVTPLSLLTAYIQNHNEQVEEQKQFEIGTVTVTDPNNYISCYTNMNSTMKEIKEDLVDDLGGYIRTRHEAGKKLIDYLADSPRVNTQAIELGVNLMDYESNIDTTEIATQVIPLGARLETSSIDGLEERLTIKSVNNNIDYLRSQEAIDKYGIITKVVTWDDVTTPEALKSKGDKWLTDEQFDNVFIKVKAIDLGNISNKKEKFKLLDSIKVISAVHGMDRYFVLTKMTLNLNDPEGDVFELGKVERTSLTARTSEAVSNAIKQIPVQSDIIKQAVEQATAMITGVEGGYVLLDIDERTNQPYRILVMDKAEKEQAGNVIQINKNGIGFSTSGINGPYKNAWTIDGKLVADFITAGTLSADRISGGTINGNKVKVTNIDANNIVAGMLKAIGINNGNGTFSVDSNGEVIANSLKSSNAEITGGSIKIVANAMTQSLIELGWQNDKRTYASRMRPYRIEVEEKDKSGTQHDYIGYIRGNVCYIGDTTDGSNSQIMNGSIALNDGTGKTLNFSATTVNGYSCDATFKSVTQSSDARLKEKRNDVSEDELKLLDVLEPCTFNFIGETDRKLGLYAQDVKSAIDDLGIDSSIVKVGDDGYYSVDYIQLIMLLIADRKNIIKRIEELEHGQY